ncbi:hypothetical protein NX722_25260 [Endozoicomonas gorgoniicola]|uniref:Homeodomain phBC6A51-type domain-containing protein n=1 Tax=Endozoicomonas gorgoniicola TaxID=1234144 RepID=A0ABT3N2M8_9GAMM|nr:helix-turn-helix transcriptional regulator [Endozoicomonas gorgoniicola]MCW7555876.1 hypothetical protein [Endozoicomonas gorgoniicola]
MAKRVWKRVYPRSIGHAMELCLEYAREKQNRSVDRVADEMGLANRWTLYKWIKNERLPAVLISAFEEACGINLVTRYLGHAAHQLLLPIPNGKRCKSQKLHSLQQSFNEAMGLLLIFHEKQVNQEQTIAALTQLMEYAAWHLGNVERYQQPGLDLTGGDHEQG